MAEKESPVSFPVCDGDLAGRCGIALGELGAGFADGAVGAAAEQSQDALLASIEARLAQEVWGVVGALNQFGSRSQAISKLIPDSSQFCKLVTSTLGLVCLQLSYTLRQGLDERIFLDDGAEYLRKACLTFEQAFREVTLDGRRYTAVARVDDGFENLVKSACGGEQC